jgi:phosphohistidine phosphatase
MPTRTIVLMRHAKSAWDTDDDDIDRPLAARGRRDGVAAGRMLADRELSVDVALVSPAARARQTLDRAVAGGLVVADARTVDAIYHGDTDDIVAAVRSLPTEVATVLVVGHYPTLPEAVHLIARRRDAAPWHALGTRFPTSALAIVAIEAEWSEVGRVAGELVGFHVPRG